MERMKQKALLEPISHRTESRPFSIHRTEIKKGAKSILYQHWHPEMELWHLIRGRAVLYIEEKPYHIQEGEAIFIPPNLIHYAEFEADYREEGSFEAIVFDDAMICDFMTGEYYDTYVKPITYNPFASVVFFDVKTDWKKECLRYIQKMCHLEHRGVEYFELELRGYLLLLWQKMYNHIFSVIDADSKHNKIYQDLINVVEYMKTHYSEEIELSQLASIACLSEGQFCRNFRRYMGESPFRYRNKLRIYKSCEKLKMSQQTVADIANDCGFSNVSFFNREFKKLVKMTPSAYRKQYVDAFGNRVC